MSVGTSLDVAEDKGDRCSKQAIELDRFENRSRETRILLQAAAPNCSYLTAAAIRNLKASMKKIGRVDGLASSLAKRRRATAKEELEIREILLSLMTDLQESEYMLQKTLVKLAQVLES